MRDTQLYVHLKIAHIRGLLRNLVVICLLLLSLTSKAAHPFYISTTEIKWNQGKNRIEISTKLFIDDLELALSAFSKKTVFLEQVDTQLVALYFLQHVKIESGSKGQLTFVGIQKDEDALWIFAEIPKTSKLPKELIVQNTLLLDVIESQKNIVRFEGNGKKQNFIFDLKTREYLFLP
jgi:hypothetical protein